MRDFFFPALLSALLLVTASGTSADNWTQTDWSGGSGQQSWADTSMYFEDSRMNGVLNPGDLHLDTPNDSIWEETGVLAGASAVLALAEDLSGGVYCATRINGDVFRSSDDGVTWSNTANIPTARSIYSLICDVNGYLWAGMDDSGDVFVSTDLGGSWNGTAELTNASVVTTLLEAVGSVYAGTYSAGDVFRTTDMGSTWLPASDIPAASDVMSMMLLNDTLWVGTYPNGDVFISTDNGGSWEAKGDIPGVEAVLSLLTASDGDIYAGTSWATGVYKTTDRGATWLETDSIPNTTLVRALAEADQVLYATSSDVMGRIFKSTDSGANWTEVFSDANVFELFCFIYTTRGFLFAGAETSTGAEVYRAGYFPAGYLVSSAYHAPGGYGTLSWSVTPNGMSETVRVRTDVNPDMSTAPPWASCPPVSNGQDISSLPSVSDAQEYVQYRVEMSSSLNSRSPFIHWIDLEYGTIIPRDVGVVRILSPESVIEPQVAVAPSALIANHGARAESLWVICEVDSVAASPSIVYSDSTMIAGFSPGDTTLAVFSDWTPGPSGSVYSLCVSASVPEDTTTQNDTVCAQVVAFLPFFEVFSNFYSAPVIDGVVSAGEWDSANAYDVSDLYGHASLPNLPGSCSASFLHDDNYLYVLVRTTEDTLLEIGDRVDLLIDDDDDGEWDPGDAEGEYRLEHTGTDTIRFVAYPGLSEYEVSGSAVAMGDGQGVVVEAAIPFGSDGPLIDAQPGDTLGLFVDLMDSGASDHLGWWPQSVPDSSRTDPLHFGDLVLAPGTGIGSRPIRETPPVSAIVMASPNPFRTSVNVLYAVSESGSEVNLSVYDASGRFVSRICGGRATPGLYSVTWNGVSEGGARVKSGVYFLKLTVGQLSRTRKITLLD